MPTTRSRSLASSATPSQPTTPSRPPRKQKRKTQDTDGSESPSAQSLKKPRVDKPSVLANPVPPDSGANKLLPAVLSFSFEDAKQHLSHADSRFKDLFEKLPCRPFEQLETVDPFRSEIPNTASCIVHLTEFGISNVMPFHSTLVTSILGQQISWLAARSITHKFIRLFDPSLPEKPPPIGTDSAKSPQKFFPTASQVVNTDATTLRSAGLSGRKVEYVQDLASRFADGRLTNEMLAQADDEELARLLIEVRGIGRWTVDMFAIFSLRRPDILPVGDLGVQRGVVRWFLSLHSPSDAFTISPKKLPKGPGEAPGDPPATPKDIDGSAVVLPGPLPSTSLASAEPDVSSLPPVPVTPIKGKGKADSLEGDETPPASPDKAGIDTGSVPMLPEPFTPSINKTLKGEIFNNSEEKTHVPLPEGITVESLKTRLTRKKVKGSFLTPKEMEELTEPWRPYRSLGVFYMWALAEEAPSK